MSEGLNVNVYYCDVTSMDIIYQPTIEEVGNADYTGEFWLLYPQRFTYLKRNEIQDMDSFYIDKGKLYITKLRR